MLVWTPLALPALKLVEPHLAPGAIIVVDNTKTARRFYGDLLAHFADEKKGYRFTELPFKGGLGVAVFLPQGKPDTESQNLGE